MSRLVSALESPTDVVPEPTDLARRLVIPVLISVVILAVVLAVIVGASESAWHMLGVGRGLVPPEYYHVSGFVIVLATMLGQAIGWAGGSALLYHLLTLAGFARAFSSWKVSMTIVYVGLGALPLLVYHVLFGGPLLGLPRQGLEDWLLTRAPDAYRLLVTAHPLVDGSVIPLGAVFLGLLWFGGEALRRSRPVLTVMALALLGTSLAVALSLAIHSTLAHLKFLP
jgi:hypothetical protein